MTTIIQRIADAILEARIKAWRAATQLFLWLGDKSAALQCWTSMRKLVELVAYKVYPNEHTNALNVPGCKIFVVQMI